MDHTKFEQHILLYGADIARWPQVLQQSAREALSENANLQQLLADEMAFEQMAMQRPALADDASFAERIIASARMHKPAPSWQLRLQIWLEDASQFLPFPKPAYALSAIAAAGFILGVALQPAENISSASSLDALLYETEII